MIDIRISKSKSALFEAASALMAKGQDPTLAQIAHKAGIGRATLHRHFASREVFINELALWALDSLEKAALRAGRFATTHEQAFFAIIKALIPLGDRYHILTKESQTLLLPEIRARIETQDRDMENLIERLQEQDILSREFSATWVSGVLDALIYTAWSQVEAGDLAANAAFDQVRRTLVNGFGTQKNKPETKG